MRNSNEKGMDTVKFFFLWYIWEKNVFFISFFLKPQKKIEERKKRKEKKKKKRKNFPSL